MGRNGFLIVCRCSEEEEKARKGSYDVPCQLTLGPVLYCCQVAKESRWVLSPSTVDTVLRRKIQNCWFCLLLSKQGEAKGQPGSFALSTAI